MNYARHYELLIARARTRLLTGYRERHHVLPRCMGGGNEKENIVELMPEEHYIAHQLLCKMHPTNVLLVYGAVAMAKRCSGNKAYGWLRRLNAKARSVAMLGKKHGAKSRSHEWRAKIRAAHLGKKLSADHRYKLSVSHRGHKPSAETRAKMSTSQRGTTRPPRSAETLEKMAAAKRGKKLPPRSAEWCAKLSQVLSGVRRRPLSAEHRANISAAALGKKRGPYKIKAA